MTARPAFDAAIMPHVEEERWAMIASVAENSGPALVQKFFGGE